MDSREPALNLPKERLSPHKPITQKLGAWLPSVILDGCADDLVVPDPGG